MSNETTLTITGNLVDDPELRFTPSGQPVAKFRVASTPRYRDNATAGEGPAEEARGRLGTCVRHLITLHSFHYVSASVIE
jgi:Single-strand binding protein family